jgi:hypothetical protein
MCVPLTPPQRDANGNVVPHDHPEILDGDDLIRRVSDQQIVTDARGLRRISSMAFRPADEPNGGMSIDIRKSIEEANLDVAAFVTTPKWIGSVVFKTSVARERGLQVGSDPIPGNDHHGEVWGNFTRAISKGVQRSSTWFVQIPGVAII